MVDTLEKACYCSTYEYQYLQSPEVMQMHLDLYRGYRVCAINRQLGKL